MRPVEDDQLARIVEAYNDHGQNKAAAAESLGLPVSTFKHQLRVAVRRNLLGDAFGGPIPEGYALGKITQMHTSADGKAMEWRHLLPTGEDPLAALKSVLEAEVAAIPEVPAAALDLSLGSGLVTIYPIPDVHLGQYSWGKETGANYDLQIAVNTVKDTFGRLLARAPSTDTAVVLALGDYFHADSYEARTPKSGNPLDVDSRFGKTQWMGAELLIEVIDRALQKHQTVHVKALPGNHDPRGGDMLTLAVWFRYQNNPRVIVDRRPGVFWFAQFGKTMVAAHHGHEAKPEQMAGVMASYAPDMWGATSFRYAYLGHEHRRKRGMSSEERGGAVWEVFQAITAADAWNRGKGHFAGRSITAITLDPERGEVYRTLEPIM